MKRNYKVYVLTAFLLGICFVCLFNFTVFAEEDNEGTFVTQEGSSGAEVLEESTPPSQQEMDQMALENKDDLPDASYQTIQAEATEDKVIQSDATIHKISDVSSVQPSQTWRINHTNNGYVYITNGANGKVLNVIGNKAEEGASVNLEKYNSSSKQQLWIVERVNEDYLIRSAMNTNFGLAFFETEPGIIRDGNLLGLALINSSRTDCHYLWKLTPRKDVIQFQGQKYVLNSKGQVDTSFTKIKVYEGKSYFFKKGVFDSSFTGLAVSAKDNKYYFVKKGVLDTSFTGIAISITNNKYYYAYKGKLDWNFTGIAKQVSNGKYYFVRKGAYDGAFTGIGKHATNGKYYFVKKGTYDSTFTGIGKHAINGKYYFVRKGTYDSKFTGVAKQAINGKYYFVKNGEYNSTFTGIGKQAINGKWYFVKKGAYTAKVTALAKSAANGKWYFVRNSVLDTSFTGVAKSVANGKWYYVKKGVLYRGFTGYAKGTDGKTRYVRNGIAV